MHNSKITILTGLRGVNFDEWEEILTRSQTAAFRALKQLEQQKSFPGFVQEIRILAYCDHLHLKQSSNMVVFFHVIILPFSNLRDNSRIPTSLEMVMRWSVGGGSVNFYEKTEEVNSYFGINIDFPGHGIGSSMPNTENVGTLVGIELLTFLIIEGISAVYTREASKLGEFSRKFRDVGNNLKKKK